jgi:ComF family protein
VPLHWVRLARRRYNQAALLANALSRISGVPAVADLLVRRRRTPSQGGLSAVGRHRNVQGAFAVGRRHADRVADRRVLLVDDVLTTGATVSACARALLRAGARAVDVAALAQVVRQG